MPSTPIQPRGVIGALPLPCNFKNEILGSVPSIYTEVLVLSEIFERKFVENYIAVHCTLEFLYIVQ